MRILTKKYEQAYQLFLAKFHSGNRREESSPGKSMGGAASILVLKIKELRFPAKTLSLTQ
jgi:hypothetical protein